MKRTKTKTRNHLSSKVPLFATVGPGSFKNIHYNFGIGDWSIEDQFTSMRCITELPADFNENNVYTAINNLENILISMFVNDHIPRRIFYFDHPHDIPKETKGELRSILGQCGDPLKRDDNITLKSVDMVGWLYNFKPDEPLDSIAPVELIEEWFGLLSKNSSVAASVGLIQESFVVLNHFSNIHRYHDYLALSKAIVLMVSGLESLFFHNSDDKADISFKFRLVGAIFYERFVPKDFIKRFGTDEKKLTFLEMKKLLGCLYDIRSKIVHGKAHSVLRGNNLKKWDKVMELLHVKLVEPSKKTQYYRQIVLSLGMLQRHILALVFYSKHNLTKGAKIVDEIY